MSSSDLANQLRLVLENSPDAPSLSALLEYVDVFVKARADAPDAEALSLQVEEDLQRVCNDVIDHKVTSQLEAFLSVIFHLHPLLPPLSVISCWFELVIRPALREPKLATPAVNHAKELILATLDFSLQEEEEENWEDEEKGKHKDRVDSFRRRLMDYYLLDAYNESSSDDVLEWARLDDLTREKKACWKANLQDILVKSGLQRPKDLLTEVYRCFRTPSSRLQLVLLLNAFTSESDFPDLAAKVMASHMVMQSLLFSLTFDNSTTLCTVGLTLLTKLLPVLAVKACEDLKQMLPQLFVVLARMICWKQRPRSTFRQHIPEDLELNPEVSGGAIEPDEFIDNTNKLPLDETLEWERLDSVFDAAVPIPPSPHQFFQFLYYLFPCNVLRFLRDPVSYLTEDKRWGKATRLASGSDLESPYTVSWKDALDEDMIRSKAEPLLRGHVVHPLLIWRDAASELRQADFWTQFDISRIVGECTMLDMRNASLGSREQERQNTDCEPPSKTSLPSSPVSIQLQAAESIVVPALSSSVESSASSVLAQIAQARAPPKPRISLQEMINTTVALKSGSDIEVVDTTPTWPTNIFRTRARSSSRGRDVEHSGTATPDTASFAHGKQVSSDDIPSHVAQAIAELQREALLLRSELNFELWMARENVKHIGRLYHDRVLSRNAEVERQGLHNKMRELKAEVHRLQKELKDHKDQTSTMKNQYLDYNQKLEEKIQKLRSEKSSWSAEATAMRAADKELRDTFVAQQKLLADAMHNVFQLETKMKENAHKIERLYDYELQIEQLVKMQRLWETDVQQLNEQNEYLKIFSSQYRKMELQVETYKSIVDRMEENTKHQRLQMQTLETQLNMSRKQLDVARRMPSQTDLSEYRRQTDMLTQANQRLRDENAELNDEIEELRAMVESLKVRVAGNRDLTSSAISSPLMSHPSPIF